MLDLPQYMAAAPASDDELAMAHKGGGRARRRPGQASVERGKLSLKRASSASRQRGCGTTQIALATFVGIPAELNVDDLTNTTGMPRNAVAGSGSVAGRSGD